MTENVKDATDDRENNKSRSQIASQTKKFLNTALQCLEWNDGFFRNSLLNRQNFEARDRKLHDCSFYYILAVHSW